MENIAMHNITEKTQQESRIELREAKIPLGYAHQFWVRYNSNGEIVSEIHGRATDSKGNLNPIMTTMMAPFGLCPIKAVVYPIASQQVKAIKADIDGGFSGIYKTNQSSVVVLRGDEEAIEARWKLALDAASMITEQNLKYTFFPDERDNTNANCNSVARSIGVAMGVPPQDFSGLKVIGQNKDLLPSHEFPHLYDNRLDILDPATYEINLLAEDSSNCVIS